MPRPKCERLVQREPKATYFKPRGIPLIQLEEVVLTLDEVEALRLADLDNLYQEAAAERMRISRATFGRIIESARRKVAGALVHGHALRLEGGVVTMSAQRTFVCNDCGLRWELPFGTGRPAACPECGSENFERADEERGRSRRGWETGRPGHSHRGRGQGRGRGRGPGITRGNQRPSASATVSPPPKDEEESRS